MKTKIVICTLVLMFSVFAGSVFGDATDTYYGTGAGTGAYNTGNQNTFIGNNAGAINTTGAANTFVGWYAGVGNTTGYDNAFIGTGAGYNNTSGYYNTSIGVSAGFYNNGYNNVFLGTGTGFNNFGDGNVFLGYQAGYNESGSNKLYISNSITSTPLIYGDFSSNIVGISGKLGVGTQAPVRQLHLAGSNAVFRMDRTVDTASFMMVRTDGSGNPMKTFVVGTNYSPTTGLGDFMIADMGANVSGASTRRMTIANNGDVTFSGSVFTNAIFNPSSLTLKDNVRTYENALDTVNRLRGVSFDWKDSGKPAVGLIAEEVAKVVPEVVAYNDGAAAGVNYASLVGVLVEAVKEQQQIVKEQQGRIQKQEGIISAHSEKIAELERLLMSK